MKQLVWNVHMEKGAFMHSKGFIKFKLRFNSSFENVLQRKKALQNISLFDVWGTQYAVPRPFWLIGLCVASISLLELNLCLKAILLQVYPKVFRDWKYMLSATFPFF
jgi:hypothetical protein